MEINIYLDQYAELFQVSFGEAMYRLMFWYFGWLPVAIAFLWLARELWLYHRASMWSEKQKYLLLAIDVPANNEQSPKSVENLFAYLHAAQSGPNLIEKWWEGKYQQSFSFEIVSIEGYIQFLIRTPAPLEEFVKTAIYAQYPMAEINEVDDYVDAAPDRFPDIDKDIWGSEFILTGPQALPIKMYNEFEHILGAPELTYRDTMASLMDTMSSMGPGEQLWIQIITSPQNFDWLKEFHKHADKLAGIKAKSNWEKSIIGQLWYNASDMFQRIITLGFSSMEAPVAPVAKEVNWMNMNPKTKKQIEGIQRKASKIAYGVKIRAIYLADKTVMNKAKGVNGTVGYFKQFTALDMNAFMPDVKKTATSTAYFQATSRVNKRKNRIINAYKNRSGWSGRLPYILNIEELATIWHFPLDAVVKAPLLQRTSSRKVEAPMTLPLSQESGVNRSEDLEPIFDQNYQVQEPILSVKQTNDKAPAEEEFIDFLESEVAKRPETPSNLPFAD